MQSPDLTILRKQSMFFQWMYEKELNPNDYIMLIQKKSQHTQIEILSTPSQSNPLPPDKSNFFDIGQKTISEPDNTSVNSSPRERRRVQRIQMQMKYHSNQKDPDFNIKNQKKNRNVLSNLVHHFLKFLSSNSQANVWVEKIINQHKLELSLAHFYSQLGKLVKGLKSYVTEKHLRSLLFGNMDLIAGEQNEFQANPQFFLIMRILAKKFYCQKAYCSVILSNKLTTESKKLHFQGIKNIIPMLCEGIGQNEQPKRLRRKPTSQKRSKMKKQCPI